jgi:hypothetical protein
MPIVSRKNLPLYNIFIKEIKFVTLKSKLNDKQRKGIKFRDKIYPTANRREVFNAVKNQIEESM